MGALSQQCRVCRTGALAARPELCRPAVCLRCLVAHQAGPLFPRLRRLRLRGLAARANAGRLSLRPNLPGSVPLLGQELLCGFISNKKKQKQKQKNQNKTKKSELGE